MRKILAVAVGCPLKLGDGFMGLIFLFFFILSVFEIFP